MIREEQERKALEVAKQLEVDRLERLRLVEEEKERLRLLEEEREQQLVPTYNLLCVKHQSFRVRSYLKRWSQAFDSRQNLYRLRRSAMCFHVWQLSAKKVRDRKCHSVNQIKSIMVATAARDRGGSHHHHHHHHALSMLHDIRRELEDIPTQPMIQPLMIVKTAILHLFGHPIASAESSVGLVTPRSLAQLVGPHLFLKQSSAVRAVLGYPDTDIVNAYAGPLWRRSLFWKVALFTDTSTVGTWNDDDNFCSNLIRACLSNKVMSEDTYADCLPLIVAEIEHRRMRAAFYTFNHHHIEYRPYIISIYTRCY